MDLKFDHLPALPVRNILPTLVNVLSAEGRAVLTAPPGAGKTTLVPLALLAIPIIKGKIVMLEPRRLAARAAAERMAALNGDAIGQTVGYRIKGETRTSNQTRIEVVTEGILTRILQSDPELTGIGAIIFDEFHERSLNADLGLALSWEVREALRPDLKLIVMSATLEAEPVAALLGNAKVLRSEGRAFAVETRWLAKPCKGKLADEMASLITTAHEAEAGDILAFLPGAREIRDVEARLNRLGQHTDIYPLFGAMPFQAQQKALAPCPDGRRKIVLATAIAETSLTVEGVRVVVDAGLARRARFDPTSGMSRLVTERAAKSESIQRQGRAGRLSEGICYRLWTRAEEGVMTEYAPPEITTSDLTGLALDLAAWGARPDDLALLTQPREAAMAEARSLLVSLGALDEVGHITSHGRTLAQTPVHPRLGHMILTSTGATRGEAITLAAMLEAGDPLRREGADITYRLRLLQDPKTAGAAEPAIRRIRQDAGTLGKRMGAKPGWRVNQPGPLIARAYPDRIAMGRPGGDARFLLSGGKGARLHASDPLASASFLAVAELEGAHARQQGEALIRLAAPIDQADIEDLFIDQITTVTICEWSRRHKRVVARKQAKLGALILDDKPWMDAPSHDKVAAMVAGIRELGIEALPWTKSAQRLAARVEWARAAGVTAPSTNPDALMDTLSEWLTPHLDGIERREDLSSLDLTAILTTFVGWDKIGAVNAAAPEVFVAPTGTSCRIDYSGEAPSVALRLQELFGVKEHPVVAGMPLVISLLSPAGRPVQTTGDLPGFWQTSYRDVRKDMRGRYPRHPWPEDPSGAEPTRKAKPRGETR